VGGDSRAYRKTQAAIARGEMELSDAPFEKRKGCVTQLDPIPDGRLRHYFSVALGALGLNRSQALHILTRR
jgi:hypothetical protein